VLSFSANDFARKELRPMMDQSDARLVRRLSIFAAAASLFSVAVGISVLWGCVFHITALKNWLPGRITTRANAALCFVLLGVAFWLLRKDGDNRVAGQKRLAAGIAAAIVTLAGLLSLAEYLFGWNLGIDQWLTFASAGEDVGGVRPGLMSPITALDFFLLGVAVLLLDWKTRRNDWPAQFLCLGVAIGAAFGLLALVLVPNARNSMALPTAVTFFVLSCGLLCSRATWVLDGLLTSPGVGGRLVRRVGPCALAVLNLIGWMLSRPLLTEAHYTWAEVSLVAVVCSVLLLGLIVWTAFIVDRSDRERERAQSALHISKEPWRCCWSGSKTRRSKFSSGVEWHSVSPWPCS